MERTQRLAALVVILAGLTVLPFTARGESTMSDQASEDVMVTTMRGLVTRTLKRWGKDPAKVGVANFTTAPVAGRVAALIDGARQGKERLRYTWKSPGGEELAAEFELTSTVKPPNLKINLLWLDLPQRYPVRPDVGVINGHKPFGTEMAETVAITDGHRLKAYAPPQ